MSVNSRHKPTKIIGQRKAFYRQKIPQPSCAGKKWSDKNHAIHLNNKQTSLDNKEVQPVQPV